jgi:osmoprotectant transport system permease protein
VLSDPKQAIPPYDAVVLVPSARANDQLLMSALRPMIDAIDIDKMRQANLQVDRTENKQSPAAAATWLSHEAQID